jgi:uncharacterized protein YjbI with pentapeptide repeats
MIADRQFMSEFLGGIAAELYTAIATAVILGVFFVAVQNAEDAAEVERQALIQRETYRAELLRDFGSADNGLALRAVGLLREQTWWTDGTLANGSYLGANLRNANLSGANLSGVDLRYADLRGATLIQTNFTNADLRYTLMEQVNTRSLYDVDAIRAELLPVLLSDISVEGMVGLALRQSYRYASPSTFYNADLRGTDFTGSNLSFSDMRGAVLLDAIFNGANLHLVDMRDAIVQENLVTAIFEGSNNPEAMRNIGGSPRVNRDTMLPDGASGSDRTDLNEYANPNAIGYTDLTVCRMLVTELQAINGSPPLYCAIRISKPIPYPPPQLGPFRENTCSCSQ